MKTIFSLAATLLFMTTAAQQIPFTGTQTDFPATLDGFLISKDINGDGIPDYFQGGTADYDIGGNSTYATYLLLGDGNGNVTESTNNTFPDLGSSDGLLEDINNDGNCDAFLTGFDSNNQTIAEIHLGDGNGNFSFHQLLSTGVFLAHAAFGDLDNDNDSDLIINGMDDQMIVHTIVYENQNGNFVEVTTIFVDTVNGDVAIFDYDNDGHNDVLITGADDSELFAKLYQNNGNFDFTFQEVSTIFTPVNRSSIAIVDLDNDGDLDVGMNGSSSIGFITHVYLNNGDGTFASPQVLTGIGFGQIVFGDINNDGFADTFIVGQINAMDGRTAKLYLNDGTGNMVLERNFSPGLVQASAVMVDMDNDTDMDIIYTGAGTAPFWDSFVKVFENTTLAVSDFNHEDVAIYPNPTRGLVNIELPNDVLVSDYRVTDMSGRQLRVVSGGNETIPQIDLSALQPGIYLLTLHTETGQSMTQRIVKH